MQCLAHHKRHTVETNNVLIEYYSLNQCKSSLDGVFVASDKNIADLTDLMNGLNWDKKQ